MAITGRLKLKSGGQSAAIYELSGKTATIGRSPECDYVIDDLEVSRQHTSIGREGDSFFVEDLNSTNGTFLNGKRLRKKKILTNGDLITIGEQHVLEFEMTEAIEGSAKEPQTPSNAPVESTEPAEQEPVIQDMQELVEEPSDTGWKKAEQKPQKKGKKPIKLNWKIILLAALAFFIVFCVLPFVVIEVTNQWCNLFSGFFNAISPGVCP